MVGRCSVFCSVHYKKILSGSCLLSVVADTLWRAYPGVDSLLSSLYLLLLSSNSISKQIGFYSLLLSIAHLWLSISTVVQKQFYYVRQYFCSHLKWLLKYNIAVRVAGALLERHCLCEMGQLRPGKRTLLGSQSQTHRPKTCAVTQDLALTSFSFFLKKIMVKRCIQ